MTDYPDYQTPQAHADTISNTGVPLLTRGANLFQVTGTVASNATVVVAGPVTVSKIGYEISLTWYAPATNQSIITVDVSWVDSVSGLVVGAENWDFYAGSGPIASAHIIHGTGPTKGDTVTLTASQNASTVTANYSISMTQNSRVYLRDDWRTDHLPPVTGITGTNNLYPRGSILAQMLSPAVASGGNVTALMPLYAGRCVITGLTNSATSDMTTFILSNTGNGGAFNNNQVVRAKTDASGNLLIVGAVLPRSQCLIEQINSNAAAKDLSAFITMAEY